MLTKRQKQVFEYIKKYIAKYEYAPSLEEIKKHLHLSSVSTAHYHVQTLQNMGYLRKEDNQPRALDVFAEQTLIQIPVLGTIAAGQPIEAIEYKENIAVPKDKLKSSENCYALRVNGNSMIDENINSGDIVIIRSQPTANNGQKVVALINNDEVTLKKIYKEKNRILLEPANPKFETVIVSPRNIRIQGVVIDIIKNQTLTATKPQAKQKDLFSNKSIDPDKDLPINKIIWGDSIENMRKLPDNSIDLIVADPPYNLSQGNKWSWNGKTKLPGFGGVWNKVIESWDNMPLKDYFSFTYQWIYEAKRILKPTGSIWVFGTYHNIGIINTIFQLLKIEIINEIIWFKRNAFPNLSGRRFTASHETLLWGHTGKKKREYYFNYEESKNFFDPSDTIKARGKQMRTIWDIPNNKDKEELKYGKHTTQKPTRICRRIISLTSKANDIVLAPFTGAGSECVAAKQLNRRYIGFESEKKYVDIAKERLNNIISEQLNFER
jgi:site-specific DNA-methyltransferase (adenine-specific)